MPSKKTLSEHLNVTRSAVRAAFDIIEGEGLVRLQGQGRVVTGAGRDPSPPVLLLAGGYRSRPCLSLGAEIGAAGARAQIPAVALEGV